MGLSLVAASLNSATLESTQRNVSAGFHVLFAVLALAFGISAWIAVSHLLAMRETERLRREKRRPSRT